MANSAVFVLVFFFFALVNRFVTLCDAIVTFLCQGTGGFNKTELTAKSMNRLSDLKTFWIWKRARFRSHSESILFGTLNRIAQVSRPENVTLNWRHVRYQIYLLLPNPDQMWTRPLRLRPRIKRNEKNKKLSNAPNPHKRTGSIELECSQFV